MSNAKELLLREKGFGFFGAITASLSHEINNTLAIINELAGLLDDFFQAADQGAPLKPKMLQKTTARIAAQIERGETYVKRLNRFAHTVDNTAATLVVNDSVTAIATLCRRLGKLRQVELEITLADPSPRIQGCDFDLQHIIFRCIDILLQASQPGDVLNVAVERQGEGARLLFANRSDIESTTELKLRRDFLSVLVNDKHGEVESTIQAGQPIQLAVALPHSLLSS